MKFSINDYAPRVLPASWSEMQPPANMRTLFGRQVRSFISVNTMVHITIDNYGPGGVWLHLSASCRNRIPQWEELKETKELFMGDRLAIQVLPPKAYYINRNEHVLHLFSRLDGESIPMELWKQEI